MSALHILSSAASLVKGRQVRVKDMANDHLNAPRDSAFHIGLCVAVNGDNEKQSPWQVTGSGVRVLFENQTVMDEVFPRRPAVLAPPTHGSPRHRSQTVLSGLSGRGSASR